MEYNTLPKTLRDKIKRDLPRNLETLNNELQEKCDKGIMDVTQAKETNRMLGKVYLVGCGTGDVELLTIDIIPSTTEQIFVGKQKGFHSIKQEEINKQLQEFANRGLSVARLKSGDPYVFGRGSEEALSMLEAGIDVEVIPGISSAIAGPLLAGIAPTARGYATNMSIVSAHLAGNRVNLEWVPMLKYNNHTMVVLMGISRAKEIKKCAQNIEVDMQKDLELLCKNALRPALIVIGDVVNLHEKLPKFGV